MEPHLGEPGQQPQIPQESVEHINQDSQTASAACQHAHQLA